MDIQNSSLRIGNMIWDNMGAEIPQNNLIKPLFGCMPSADAANNLAERSSNDQSIVS